MTRCDVVIAGGGPAGSTCAWKLREAGLDVIVLDAASFPRDKVCAGWITPQVVSEVGLDVEDYRRGRTWQPIRGFRVGVIDRDVEVASKYAMPVSYGIRRCEFDHYLLTRAAVRTCLGTAVTSIRKTGGEWIVNDAIRSPMLVGAGGQFCPVARLLNTMTPPPSQAPLVVAQEAEFAIEADDSGSFTVEPDVPELFFSRDLKGYGWCFRKQDYLNIGLGRQDRRSLPTAMAAFVAFLQARRKIPSGRAWRWRGHAYALFGAPHRRVSDDGVVLIGDAAGVAYPQSGEGIRPAIESALLAAATIVEADGRYTHVALERYEQRLRARLGASPVWGALSRIVPDGITASLSAPLLSSETFVKHVVLDRWFLHRHEPALPASARP
jgi:geranylgeranyl reductase family protein